MRAAIDQAWSTQVVGGPYISDRTVVIQINV